MITPEILYAAGGMLSGIMGLKIIEALVKKTIFADNITRSEFEQFKTGRESLVNKEEFRQFKLDCATTRAACQTCLAAMKDKQLALRENLPREYVVKSDFRQEMSDIKEWLKSIDDKVEALLMNKEDLFSSKEK